MSGNFTYKHKTIKIDSERTVQEDIKSNTVYITLNITHEKFLSKAGGVFNEARYKFSGNRGNYLCFKNQYSGNYNIIDLKSLSIVHIPNLKGKESLLEDTVGVHTRSGGGRMSASVKVFPSINKLLSTPKNIKYSTLGNQTLSQVLNKPENSKTSFCYVIFTGGLKAKTSEGLVLKNGAPFGYNRLQKDMTFEGQGSAIFLNMSYKKNSQGGFTMTGPAKVLGVLTKMAKDK